MRLALRLAVLLTASALDPTVFAAPQKVVESRRIRDRVAGVGMDVTLPHGEVLHGEKLEARLANLPSLWLPPGTTPTSAVFVPGSKTPYLVVSKRQVEGGINRDLVDLLTVSPERSPVASGLGRFLFYPEHLQGVADSSATARPRAKVVMQLVKDRATYVTFFYQKPEELAAFARLHQSLYAGKKSKLYLSALPRQSNAASLGLGGILMILAAGSGIALATFLFYRRERSVRVATPVPSDGPIVALEPGVEMRRHPVV